MSSLSTMDIHNSARAGGRGGGGVWGKRRGVGKPAQTCQRMSQSVLVRRSFKVKRYLSYDLKLVH